MSVFVIGGAGFIGRRLIPKLVAMGERVVCMDLAAAPAVFDPADDRIRMVRGDISQFDDVISRMAESGADRVVNLAYFIGTLAPHTATKLNIVGMDNCFEAARILGVKHTVFASSLAVSGMQKNFGDRPVNEDEYRFGDNQYASHKIFNEWQATDYADQYGMTITCVRPANVTGPDKLFGSIDHVNCICQPARGKPVSFPFADTMRNMIAVEDIAEVFARVTMAEKPRHAVYNSGGQTVSLAELAGIVRSYLPDADIRFERESGGREVSGNYLIDNTRLIEEFGLQYPPLDSRVREIINHIRREEGLPEVG